MSKTYAGIGSRKTPPHILKQMNQIGMQLAKLGYVLRSGAAEGADSAFEAGCDAGYGQKEIYLPWAQFNGHPSRECYPTREALELAELYHPAWAKCTQGVRKMHARNMHQILGAKLDSPAEFVICWHPGYGGTMQAVRLAVQRKIPVINLARLDMTEMKRLPIEVQNIITEADHG